MKLSGFLAAAVRYESPVLVLGPRPLNGLRLLQTHSQCGSAWSRFTLR